MNTRCIHRIAAALTMSLIGPSIGSGGEMVALRAGKALPGAGAAVDKALVVVSAGKISFIGAAADAPEDARLVEFDAAAVITPGLIDACCVIGSELQQSSEEWTSGPMDRSLFRRLAEHARTAEFLATLTQHECGAACGGQAGNPQHGEAGHTCCGACCGPQLQNTNLGFAMATPPDAVWAEQSSEVTPHIRVIDSVDPLSNDFHRLVRSGVTAVYVTPDTANVIGARGAIMKTAGPLESRVIEPAGAVRIALGSDPIRRGNANFLPPVYGPPPSVYTRRPTTRMGVEWVFQKAFYDAGRAAAGVALTGADQPPADAIPALQDILAGRLPVRIHARKQHDIFTALRLMNGIGAKFILEEATEAYRCLPQLQASQTPVVFGPAYMTPQGYRARSGETSRARLNTPRQLADAKITFALTAQEMRDEDGLIRQAAIAAANGLSADAALAAVTSTPAALLGLADQRGTLRAGAAADLVVWSGDPLASTSRPLLVLIDGEIVFDDRRD